MCIKKTAMTTLALVLAAPLLLTTHYARALNLTLSQIDQYLVEQESEFANITKGLEKQVRWHGEKSKTPLAIVYLHGFSASAKEISPVTENLADRLKANAYYVRLRGHARDGAAMAQASVEDWKQDVLEAFEIAKLIGEEIVLVSTSTGGTLSTWLTSLNDPSLSRVKMSLLVSPNFGLANKSGEMMRWSWGLQLAKWVKGDEHSFVPQNELHSLYWTERYPLEAIVPMINLLDEVNEIDLGHVTTPQHFIYSPNDQVIDVSAIDKIEAKYSSAPTTRTEVLTSEDPGQHVIAGEACSPSTTAEVVEIMAQKIISAP